MIRCACIGLMVLVAARAAPAAEKELHVVALDECPETVTVTVDRPGREVVLIVSAAEQVEWNVIATPKTKLTKVILGGDKRQSAKVPPGTETDELSRECVKQRILPISIYAEYEVESSQFRSFVRRVCGYTKLEEVASFQLVFWSTNSKASFVVDTIQTDERLKRDFPKVTPAAQLPELKFRATRLAFGNDGAVNAEIGEFTQAGPTAGSFTRLPTGIRQVAAAGAERRYGLDRYDLFAPDAKRGARAKIEHPDGFLWARALTYDAKRERVLVSTLGGLFEYAPKGGGQWTFLAKDAPLSLAAIAWQQKTDTLFAFGVARDLKREKFNVPTLYELKADGTVANRTVLAAPIISTFLGDHGTDGHAELVDLGGELALLIFCESYDRGTSEQGKPEAFLYVIDPKTGKVKLAWKE